MAMADRRLPAPSSLAWRSSSRERGRRAAAGAGRDAAGSASGGGGCLANAGLFSAGGGCLGCALWRAPRTSAICHRAGGGGFFGGPFSSLRAASCLDSTSRAPTVALKNSRPAPSASQSAALDARWRCRVPTPLACCSIKFCRSAEGIRFSRPADLDWADPRVRSSAVGTRGGGGPLCESGGGEWHGMGGAASDEAGAEPEHLGGASGGGAASSGATRAMAPA